MSTVTTRLIPFGEYSTWIRIETPDAPRDDALPLVVLHGGPGMAHNYVRNLGLLADETGRTVVHYDQLGCGNSTHVPEAPAEFWTPQLFVDEFENLLAELDLGNIHLLGQSWGGMLAAEIAVRQYAALASVSICNSPASMQLWSEAASALRDELSAEVQAALEKHEAAGTLTDPEYLAASDVFYKRHVCRLTPTPPDFQESVDQMEAEPTVYHTMNGPNEFHVVGTMRSWTVIDRLEAVIAPTLVVAGEFDEATPSTWEPFATRIAGATTHVFDGASHCVHLEQPEIFRAEIARFLRKHDHSHSDRKG